MKVRMSLLLCLVAITTQATAQQNRTETFPYTGKVVGQSVNVRSGPAVDPVGCYECATVSDPAKVTVLGKNSDGTWLKIEPPAGCFSVIPKANVKLDANGKTGVVVGADRVRVYAGTSMKEVAFSKSQGRLLRDSEVTVLGTITDKNGSEFYKIKPPVGAYLWIHSNFVQRTDETVSSSFEKTESTEKTEKVEKTDNKDTKKEPVSTETLEEVKAAISAIDDADKQLRAEMVKSLDQRNLLGVLEKYEAIKLNKNSSLKVPLEKRIYYVRYYIKKQEDARLAAERYEESVRKQDEIAIERAKIHSTKPEKDEVKPYAVEGVLSASAIYNGKVGLKRYIVRDSKTRRINAYVECSSGDVDLGDYVGDMVGVVGDVRFDKSLAVNIVDAKQVVVLQKDVPTPGPAEPVITNPPKVEPKTESVEEPKTETKTEPTTESKTEPKTESGDNEGPTRLIDIGKTGNDDSESANPKEEEKEDEPATKPEAESDEEEPEMPAPIVEIEVEPETPKAVDDESADEPDAKSEEKPATTEEKKSGDSEKSEEKKPDAKEKEPAEPEKSADPADPLPPTGLPVVESEPTKNPVNEKEYQ